MIKKPSRSRAAARPLPDVAPLSRSRNDSLLLNPLPDLYFRTDAKGTILEYGGAEIGRLAIPSHQLNGKNLSRVLSAKEAKLIMPAMARAIQYKQPTQIEYA